MSPPPPVPAAQHKRCRRAYPDDQGATQPISILLASVRVIPECARWLRNEAIAECCVWQEGRLRDGVHTISPRSIGQELTVPVNTGGCDA